MNSQPTLRQLERCALMGWTYLGDGLFAKAGRLGWFDGQYFTSEAVAGPDDGGPSHKAQLKQSEDLWHTAS